MSYEEATDTYLKLNLVVAYAVYISVLFAFAYQSMGAFNRRIISSRKRNNKRYINYMFAE